MNLADIFSNYFEVRQELVSTVTGLTQEQFDWVPLGHSNTIGGLLAHISETEFWWIRVVARREIDYESADFSAYERASRLVEIMSLLEDSLSFTKTWLQDCLLKDWDSVEYDVPGHDRTVSMRWLAWHVVEHQARHRGQIFMMMRTQSLDVPNV